MEARELLEELRNEGADIRIVDDVYIEISDINLTDAQRQAIRAHKPKLLKILGSDMRRQRLFQMMADDDQPGKRYWLTDTESDPDYVILALAIRDVGTCELRIPREKYDPFLVIEALEREQ